MKKLIFVLLALVTFNVYAYELEEESGYRIDYRYGYIELSPSINVCNKAKAKQSCLNEIDMAGMAAMYSKNSKKNLTETNKILKKYGLNPLLLDGTTIFFEDLGKYTHAMLQLDEDKVCAKSKLNYCHNYIAFVNSEMYDLKIQYQQSLLMEAYDIIVDNQDTNNREKLKRGFAKYQIENKDIDR